MNVLRPLFFLLLVILALALLLNVLGVTRISTGDAVLGTATIALLPVLFAFLRRSRRSHPEVFRDAMFGSIRQDVTAPFGDALYQMGFGEIALRLTDAALPAGEHTMTLNGAMGGLEVRVPNGVSVQVDAGVTVGSIDVMGRKTSGILKSLQVTPAGYETAPRRLRLQLDLAYGEIRVVASDS